MRKIGLFMMSLLLVSTIKADNETITQDASQLPGVSREFITTHFKGVNIAHIIIEKNLLGIKGYDVILTNGIDIEFNKSGEWEEVDGNKNSIPCAIIPQTIANYLKTNFPGNDIVKIEQDWNDFEIKLKSGLELTFDKRGKLIDIDD